VVIVIGTIFGSAVGALILAGVLAEVAGVLNWATHKLLRTATVRVPARYREIRSEEWAAELEALECARVSRLFLAWGFLRAATGIASSEPKDAVIQARVATATAAGGAVTFTGHGTLSAEGRTVSEHLTITDHATVSVSRVTTEAAARLFPNAEWVTHERAGD
jgi:hypothetical protein